MKLQDAAPTTPRLTLRQGRSLAVSIGGPMVLGLATFVAINSFAGQLPDPVATHWGPSGQPNGFTARDAVAWTSGLFAGGLGAALGGLLRFATRGTPMMGRIIGALSCAVAGLIGAIGVGTVWIQRGLADAHAATDVTAPMLLALLVAGLCGVCGALLMPGQVPGSLIAHDAIPTGAPRVPLGVAVPTTWRGRAQCTSLPVIVSSAMVLAVAGFAVFGAATVPILVVVALAALAVVSMSNFRVTVGEDGLVVRSVVGWPRFHVPLDQVAEAEVVEINPLRQFGGWGVRGDRKGRFGVVLRTGPALEVLRGDDSRFVVTLDDASDAAALLNTLADRSRGNP